jgi:poly-beta-hydroxyalkanoate depolymerase
MFYQLYEMNHAMMAPWRTAADAMRLAFSNPMNPVSHTYFGRAAAAGLEVFERATRRYGKPEFGLPEPRSMGSPCRSAKGSSGASRSATSYISSAACQGIALRIRKS